MGRRRGRRSKKCDLNRAPSLSLPFIPTPLPLPCHLSADRPSAPSPTIQRPFTEGLAVRKTEERNGGNGGDGERNDIEIHGECLILEGFFVSESLDRNLYYLSLILRTKVVRLLLRKGLEGPRKIGRLLLLLLLLMLLRVVVVGGRGVVGRADLLQAAVVGRRGGPLRGRHPRHDAHVLHPRHSGRGRGGCGGGSRGRRRGHRGGGGRLRRSNSVRRGRCGRLCDRKQV